ncbi:plasmid partition protein [Streptomyces halstedii]|uniref:Plasmid partition protein n=1 Tax=Streptomyces halstedii TaxID=1944 RepID=A0ABS6U0S4_STRHA|nr:plasmid partition protein [Streptomyces halstedii]MBV7674143.1 plasmid partition protein [Streptomyces halstedii]
MLIANVSPRTGGKTTNSGWLAHALLEAEAEYDVIGFDADHSQQFRSWSITGEFAFPVKPAATAKFHDEITVPDGKTGIVDCGHTENHPDITNSVLRVADLVILHMSPTKADFDRIIDPPDKTKIGDIIAMSAALRGDRKPPPTWVLLNRTIAGASSTGLYREMMEDEGWNVLTTVIPRSEAFGQSVSFPVSGAAKGPFGTLVTELEKKGLLK